RRAAKEARRKPPAISAAAMRALEAYSWPGNVRELENVIRNLVLTAKTETLLAADIKLRDDLYNQQPMPANPEDREEEQETSGDEPAVLDPGVFRDVEEGLSPLFNRLVEARGRGHRFSTFDVVERAMILH